MDIHNYVNSVRTKKIKDLTQTDIDLLIKIIDQFSVALHSAWLWQELDSSKEVYLHEMRSEL